MDAKNRLGAATLALCLAAGALSGPAPAVAGGSASDINSSNRSWAGPVQHGSGHTRAHRAYHRRKARANHRAYRAASRHVRRYHRVDLSSSEYSLPTTTGASATAGNQWYGERGGVATAASSTSTTRVTTGKSTVTGNAPVNPGSGTIYTGRNVGAVSPTAGNGPSSTGSGSDVSGWGTNNNGTAAPSSTGSGSDVSASGTNNNGTSEPGSRVTNLTTVNTTPEGANGTIAPSPITAPRADFGGTHMPGDPYAPSGDSYGAVGWGPGSSGLPSRAH